MFATPFSSTLPRLYPPPAGRAGAHVHDHRPHYCGALRHQRAITPVQADSEEFHGKRRQFAVVGLSQRSGSHIPPLRWRFCVDHLCDLAVCTDCLRWQAFGIPCRGRSALPTTHLSAPHRAHGDSLRGRQHLHRSRSGAKHVIDAKHLIDVCLPRKACTRGRGSCFHVIVVWDVRSPPPRPLPLIDFAPVHAALSQ